MMPTQGGSTICGSVNSYPNKVMIEVHMKYVFPNDYYAVCFSTRMKF